MAAVPVVGTVILPSGAALGSELAPSPGGAATLSQETLAQRFVRHLPPGCLATVYVLDDVHLVRVAGLFDDEPRTVWRAVVADALQRVGVAPEDAAGEAQEVKLHVGDSTQTVVAFLARLGPISGMQVFSAVSLSMAVRGDAGLTGHHAEQFLKGVTGFGPSHTTRAAAGVYVQDDGLTQHALSLNVDTGVQTYLTTLPGGVVYALLKAKSGAENLGLAQSDPYTLTFAPVAEGAERPGQPLGRTGEALGVRPVGAPTTTRPEHPQR